MVRTPTLVQLSDAQVALLDEVATRARRSRSELIREAIDRYLQDVGEVDLDARIVAGYEAQPPEDPWGDDSARRMIEAEPW